MKVFRVMYFWRGEKHVAYQGTSLSIARMILAELNADSWQCWIEEN